MHPLLLLLVIRLLEQQSACRYSYSSSWCCSVLLSLSSSRKVITGLVFRRQRCPPILFSSHFLASQQKARTRQHQHHPQFEPQTDKKSENKGIAAKSFCRWNIISIISWSIISLQHLVVVDVLEEELRVCTRYRKKSCTTRRRTKEDDRECRENTKVRGR